MTPGRARGGHPRGRRRALSRQASVSSSAARRQAQQGPGAGLGAQPLLLSVGRAAQGRRPDEPLHDRELRRDWVHRILDHDGYGEEEGGIERWLVLTDAPGPRPRLRHLHARARCPRPASPSRPMSISCASSTLVEAVASSLTELFAPQIHQRAHLRHARELRLHRATRRCSISSAASTRRRATPTSPSTTSSATRARRGANRRRRCPALQMQRALGAARCAASRLCRPGADPARRLRAGPA